MSPGRTDVIEMCVGRDDSSQGEPGPYRLKDSRGHPWQAGVNQRKLIAFAQKITIHQPKLRQPKEMIRFLYEFHEVQCVASGPGFATSLVTSSIFSSRPLFSETTRSAVILSPG